MNIDLSVDSSTNAETETETRKEGVDYIVWNGDEYESFIESEDGQKVPKIDERFVEGEMYAFSGFLGWQLGSKIGESELSSAIHDESDDRFPNLAIGQTESGLELENAISPGHYWYRVAGAKDSKDKIKGKFHDKCEEMGIPKNLEVYKRNFPVRQHPESGKQMVTVKEVENKPWENHQVPAQWAEEYAENDGMPPVVMEEPKPEPEPESESESEPEPEFDGKIDVPDDVWESCNTDSARIRSILDHNPGFAALEKSDKVEILTGKPFEFGKSNVYTQLKEWNSESESEPESEPESDGDTVEIDAGELADLRMKAQKYDEIQGLLGN